MIFVMMFLFFKVPYAHRFGGIETYAAPIKLEHELMFLMHTASAVLRRLISL